MGYDGTCRHIHGHSYRLSVSVTGRPDTAAGNPKNGMVLDFGDLKKIVEERIIQVFDHALLLRKDAPLAAQIAEAYEKVLLLDFQPTCEMLTLHFVSLLTPFINPPLQLHSIRLYETAGSFAEWINPNTKKQ